MGPHWSWNSVRAALCAAAAVLAFHGMAQAGSLTFLSPREVVMRHNGTPVRGQVKSMTSDEVVMILRSGVEKSYAMSGVASIIAADKSFQYMPNQESFDDFLAKAGSIRGVTVVRDESPDGATSAGGSTKMIGSVSDGYARAVGMQPSATPQAGSSGGGFVQSGGFAGSSQRPQALARLEAPEIAPLDPAAVSKLVEEKQTQGLAATTPKFALPGGTVAAVQPPASSDASEEVLICSNPNCQKEVRGAKYGQTCPHCGMIWAQQSNTEVIASTPVNGAAPVVDARNPFARAPAPQSAPVALPNTAVPAAVAPAAAPQGFALETIPWWGKLGGFGASIMVLMWILGRR